MRDPGFVSGVSVAHQHADVAAIDAASADSQRKAVETLLAEPNVAEAFVLQTCNRAERYVVTRDRQQGQEILEQRLPDLPSDALVELPHEASLEHLLRVAAGLESLVPGEDQILGQVRDARDAARHAGGLGPVLEEAVTKAIHVGERARTETAINDGVVSLGSAAVELADRQCDLSGATAVIVGAGEIATLAAKSLDDRANLDRMVIANRTLAHADHVASTVEPPARAVELDALRSATGSADLVVSATASSDPIFDVSWFDGAGKTVVIDMGQPRDVPTGVDSRSAIDVFDLDDLEAVTAQTRADRAAATREVESIVDTEFEHLLTRYKRTRADDVISSMYESAERVKAHELERAMADLDLDAEQREVIEAMADSLVNRLLAAPTESLRDAAENDDWSTINTALQLFDPIFETDDSPAAATAEDEVRKRLSRAVDADD